jgi:sugar phosphate isomerase/epimerase
MGAWPVGLSTGCFYQKSIFDCLEAIATSGFDRVEVCSSPAHLDYHDKTAVRRAAERLNALGIEAYSFHAPFADHIDITSPDCQARNASLQDVFSAVQAAGILGVTHFVIHPGPERSVDFLGEERARRLENVASGLSLIAHRCQQLGMTCVLENKLPHLLFGNLPDILWILEAITVTPVGVCLDTGHAYLAGYLRDAAQRLARYLKMVHASDNRGKYDDHLPPGEGEIDWVHFLRELQSSGFQGSLIMEIAGGDREPNEVLESAQRARQFLKENALSSTKDSE